MTTNMVEPGQMELSPAVADGLTEQHSQESDTGRPIDAYHERSAHQDECGDRCLIAGQEQAGQSPSAQVDPC